MSEALKPCPFCKTIEPTALTKHHKEEMWNFVHRCKVMGIIALDWSSRERIIQRWNTRAADPRIEAAKALAERDEWRAVTFSAECAREAGYDRDAAALDCLATFRTALLKALEAGDA